MLAAGATRAEAALQVTTMSTSCATSFSVQREGQQVKPAATMQRLPLPTHTERANFQAAICGRCLEAKTQRAIEHGWTEGDSKLNILWMRSVSAPEVVLKLLACKC